MKKKLGIICMFISINSSALFAHKLVSFNIWGGHLHNPLIKFVQSHKDIDFFCLQEVYHNAPHKISTDDNVVTLDIFSQLQKILSDHKGYFLPIVDNIYGIGMFIRKNIKVMGHGKVKIHDNPQYIGRGPTHSRYLQWVKCQSGNNIFYILNVHGLWNGKGKSDSPERIQQSEKIREFMDSLEHPFVLCGDFNLTPDTQSIKILEPEVKNLIILNEIKSTRTSFYPKKIRYADYVFTSSDIKVNSFKVMPEEASDHAPLFLQFDIIQKDRKTIRPSNVREVNSGSMNPKTKAS